MNPKVMDAAILVGVIAVILWALSVDERFKPTPPAKPSPFVETR